MISKISDTSHSVLNGSSNIKILKVNKTPDNLIVALLLRLQNKSIETRVGIKPSSDTDADQASSTCTSRP